MEESTNSAISRFMSGDKLYQKRARLALPILVRQANASQKIYYADLAREIKMPNPRNLDRVLGCVGDALIELQTIWNEDIPPIQGIVVNQQTDLPGDSVHFIREKLSPRDKEARCEEAFVKIFAYTKWQSILEEFGLLMLELPNPESGDSKTKHGQIAESEEHKRLKVFIANNPDIVGFRKSLAPGKTEVQLPSGDIPDVIFQNSKCRIVVEVKSRKSNENDIYRGIFQCVKYRSVLKACRSVELGNYEVNSILAIEGELTTDLIKIKNTLGVKVIENVKVHENS